MNKFRNLPTAEQMQKLVAINFRLEPDGSMTCSFVQRKSASHEIEGINWGQDNKLLISMPDPKNLNSSLDYHRAITIVNIVSACLGKEFQIVEKNDSQLLFHSEDYQQAKEQS